MFPIKVIITETNTDVFNMSFWRGEEDIHTRSHKFGGYVCYKKEWHIRNLEKNKMTYGGWRLGQAVFVHLNKN